MKLKHDVRVLEMLTCSNGMTRQGDDGSFPALANTKNWQSNNLAPDTRYAVLMVPIPDGHRLAVDGERGRYLSRIGDYSRVAKEDMEWAETDSGASSIIIAPIKSERDIKREAVEARIEAAEAELKKARVELGKMP